LVSGIIAGREGFVADMLRLTEYTPLLTEWENESDVIGYLSM
jgi:hypothetical protein